MIALDFSNKTIIVTGGGTGIGFSIARSFLLCGANVIICGRRKEILNDAKRKLENITQNGRVKLTVVACDMSNESEISSLVEKAIDLFSHLDIVVNNAGVFSSKSISNITGEDIIYTCSNNLSSTVLCTKIAAKSMVRGGAIINVGSFAGIMAIENASLYSCFKSAVASFTRSAASEFAEMDIRVNCIIPGVIRTSMTSKYIDDNYETLIKPVPLKRVGEADEVANGVLFLSSKLASYITGTCLEISGGKYIVQL